MKSRPNADPALAALAEQPADAPVVLLHSGRRHDRWASRSLLAVPEVWFTHHADGTSTLTDHRGRALPFDSTGRVWADLRRLLHDPRYQAGRWFGYFSYDLGRVIESGKLPPPPQGGWPLVQLGWTPHVIDIPAAPHAKPERSAGLGSTEPPPTLTPDFTPDAYRAAVQRCIDYIAAGDVFQVNLAQRYACQWSGHPRKLFQRLAAVSPAWYGAYVEMPDVGRGMSDVSRALLSTSPELFLQVGDGHVITRPIKGTRPTSDIRHPTSDIEDPQRHDLLHSVKDAAELHMIVDLLRNDLGKVCSYGSVRVTEPRTIESHPTVHHGVATIEGRLHPRKDIVDLLKATLPGGSITGAPKVRAMQIIDELEPVPRGPYCGSIGWITPDACQLNIAIRTMTLHAKPERSAGLGPSDIPHPTYNLSFHVGGGIVADSQPDAEYNETLDKARAMLGALGVASIGPAKPNT